MTHNRNRGVLAAVGGGLALLGGCAGQPDPYGHLTWVELEPTDGTEVALAYDEPRYVALGAGDTLGAVSYDSYLAWIGVPAEQEATLVEFPVED